MATRQGQTLILSAPPSILGFGTIASKKESEGPLASYIDILEKDSYFGQSSWEKAESTMQLRAAQLAMENCSLNASDIQYAFAGDLLNQCIGSHYGMRDTNIPFVGLYGACSTMAESLALAALFVEGGFATHTMAVTSSHFCSSERQFRFPLAYGGQRTPTSQWTVTGAGAAVVGARPASPYIRAITFGAIADKGVTDITNMGAAMAPAAAQTLTAYFQDTNTGPENYDLILTGDLAWTGSELFYQLMDREGVDVRKKHADCGLLIYDRDTQNVDSGGSGCGCSATVLCSYILKSMGQGKLNNILFIATGALMSTISIQQGESIPSIAHLVHLSTSPS